jgi:hypothetical protein
MLKAAFNHFYNEFANQGLTETDLSISKITDHILGPSLSSPLALATVGRCSTALAWRN